MAGKLGIEREIAGSKRWAESSIGRSRVNTVYAYLGKLTA